MSFGKAKRLAAHDVNTLNLPSVLAFQDMCSRGANTDDYKAAALSIKQAMLETLVTNLVTVGTDNWQLALRKQIGVWAAAHTFEDSERVDKLLVAWSYLDGARTRRGQSKGK